MKNGAIRFDLAGVKTDMIKLKQKTNKQKNMQIVENKFRATVLLSLKWLRDN